MFLSASAVVSIVLAKSAQVVGFWRVGGGEIASTDFPTLGEDSSAQDSEDSHTKHGSSNHGTPEEGLEHSEHWGNGHHKKE
jgi:hypothetical protein